MKIGLVLDDGLDRPDGVQQYVLTLGAWLKRQGHTVHYLVGQTKRQDIMHVHSLSKNLKVRFNKNRLSIPVQADKRAIRSLLDSEKYDVLHVQMPFSPLLSSKIIRAAPPSTAVVGTYHIVPYSYKERMGNKLLARLTRKTIRRFDSVMSVSDAAARTALKSGGLTTKVVPNMVDSSLFSRGKRNAHEGIEIVFLGRLVSRKGCQELLRAVALLNTKQKLIGVHITIVGSGPQAKSLKAYVKSHKLSMVDFTGQATEAEKADYFATADIVVLPSLGGESFGIVILEAIAAGQAVVLGGDNEGYRTVLDDRMLVRVTDEVAFADKLEQLISDKALRAQLHKWQQKRLHDFDVSVVGAEIVKEYQAAIAKHARKPDNVDHE